MKIKRFIVNICRETNKKFAQLNFFIFVNKLLLLFIKCRVKSGKWQVETRKNWINNESKAIKSVGEKWFCVGISCEMRLLHQANRNANFLNHSNLCVLFTFFVRVFFLLLLSLFFFHSPLEIMKKAKTLCFKLDYSKSTCQAAINCATVCTPTQRVNIWLFCANYHLLIKCK